MTFSIWIVSSLLSIAAILYLVLVILSARRQVISSHLALLLCVYAICAFGLTLVEVLWHFGKINHLDVQVYSHLEFYGMLALSFVLVYLVRSSLRLKQSYIWLVIMGLIVIFLVIIHTFPMLQVLWRKIPISLPYEYSDLTIVTIGWLIFETAAILAAWFALQRIQQPLHRNRVSYWLPTLIFLVMNDGMLLFYGKSWGGLLRIMAALLLLYSLTQHHLLDLQQALRRVLTILLGIGLIAFVYYLGYRAQALIIGSGLRINPFATGLVLTLILVTIFSPISYLFWRLLNPPVNTRGYHPNQALHDYSLSISNILDIEHLASVMVELITTTLNIRNGILFLVDKELDHHGLPRYCLRSVQADVDSVPVGILKRDSPVVHTLYVERRPLLQYDIDILPDYQRIRKTEGRWLKSLKVEVYIPIISKNEWIGMLAFAEKSSGMRYTADDLNVLSGIANQTAVALENARLVSNLVRLNREIRQAYQALDHATHELERLDRTKSDFISIASHELRTPLTTMRGYTEMLLDEPGIKEDPTYLNTVQGIHKGIIRLHEIMDSMFDITMIDTRTFELQMQDLDLSELIHSVCSGLIQSAQDREQALMIDLPSLPSIKADPATIRKMFFHLIINAIKFTPNNGIISIVGRVLSPNGRDLPEGGVEIIVIDSGIGVDPEFKETIFTKFYQPMDDLNKHSTGKTKFKGSGAGLGLALSKGIVEAHGGRIWVESLGNDEVNFPGSQFHVVLPLQRQSESETIRISSAIKMKL